MSLNVYQFNYLFITIQQETVLFRLTELCGINQSKPIYLLESEFQSRIFADHSQQIGR